MITQPPPRRPAGPPPRRGGFSALGWVIVVLILALVGGLVAFGLAASDDDPPDEATGDTSTTLPAEEVPPEEQASAETTTTAAETTTTTEAEEAIEDLPDGWTSYTDPVTGYAIGHPEDWDVVPASSSATDFRSPDGSYLRVDWVQPPGDDPVEAWEAAEEDFAASHEDYERIRIDETEFQDHDGAIWEFTYEEGGTDLRALNLGFVTEDRGYALYFQTAADDWNDSEDTFEAFQDTFRLAGDSGDSDD